MNITPHFTYDEMRCKCGCGRVQVSTELCEMLEKLRAFLGGRPITVTSGFRCPSHSVAVGGYADDAHTRGIAADITVSGYTPAEVCEAAEIVGFSGIGKMANAVHVDIRNPRNYKNAHWFGDETTGKDVATFITGRFNKSKSREVARFTIGGKTYIIMEE